MENTKVLNGFIGIEKRIKGYNGLYSIIVSACSLPFVSPALGIILWAVAAVGSLLFLIR